MNEFLQALLPAIFAYLSAQGVPWFLGSQTGSLYYLSRPLIAGAIVGLIMGDLEKGIIIGVALQAVFLSTLAVGGTVSTDLPFASYIGIPIAMKAGGDIGIAVTLAATLGILGIFVHNFMNAINVFWYNRAVRVLKEQKSISGFFRVSFIYSQITTAFLRIIPAFFAIYYGQVFVQDLVSILPDFIMRGLNAMGGILPALGIAMLMQQAMKEKIGLVFFLLGFFLIASVKVNMITLTVIGATFALLEYRYTLISKGNYQESKITNDDEEIL